MHDGNTHTSKSLRLDSAFCSDLAILLCTKTGNQSPGGKPDLHLPIVFDSFGPQDRQSQGAYLSFQAAREHIPCSASIRDKLNEDSREPSFAKKTDTSKQGRPLRCFLAG